MTGMRQSSFKLTVLRKILPSETLMTRICDSCNRKSVVFATAPIRLKNAEPALPSRYRYYHNRCILQYNFVGRILGPRGLTAKQLEQEAKCKIMVRGTGSMRDKKKVRVELDLVANVSTILFHRDYRSDLPYRLIFIK